MSFQFLVVSPRFRSQVVSAQSYFGSGSLQFKLFYVPKMLSLSTKVSSVRQCAFIS